MAEFLICLNRTQGVAVWGETYDGTRLKAIYKLDLLPSTLTTFRFCQGPVAQPLEHTKALKEFERVSRLPRVDWPITAAREEQEP